MNNNNIMKLKYISRFVVDNDSIASSHQHACEYHNRSYIGGATTCDVKLLLHVQSHVPHGYKVICRQHFLYRYLVEDIKQL